MAKKSYNPFKMWGSWVGAVIGLSSPFLPIGICKLQGSGCGELGYALGAMIIVSPIGLILGFLLGWGIHSLVRKLR